MSHDLKCIFVISFTDERIGGIYGWQGVTKKRKRGWIIGLLITEMWTYDVGVLTGQAQSFGTMSSEYLEIRM
ncbi:MAG: hypothetical protein IPN15_22855 [Saprospiraceae bacterium]|nr:hypothetical protein [Candidatus Vicinibacter affinis]